MLVRTCKAPARCQAAAFSLPEGQGAVATAKTSEEPPVGRPMLPSTRRRVKTKSCRRRRRRRTACPDGRAAAAAGPRRPGEIKPSGPRGCAPHFLLLSKLPRSRAAPISNQPPAPGPPAAGRRTSCRPARAVRARMKNACRRRRAAGTPPAQLAGRADPAGPRHASGIVSRHLSMETPGRWLNP